MECEMLLPVTRRTESGRPTRQLRHGATCGPTWAARCGPMYHGALAAYHVTFTGSCTEGNITANTDFFGRKSLVHRPPQC